MARLPLCHVGCGEGDSGRGAHTGAAERQRGAHGAAGHRDPGTLGALRSFRQSGEPWAVGGVRIVLVWTRIRGRPPGDLAPAPRSVQVTGVAAVVEEMQGAQRDLMTELAALRVRGCWGGSLQRNKQAIYKRAGCLVHAREG